MDINFVQNNIDTFIKIVQDFANDARLLVTNLSQAYNLKIDNKLPINTFFNLKNQMQNGIVDEQWSYFFHGYECRFQHKNRHTVDVILKFEDEYGALDPLFLGKYINTNPKYANTNVRVENEFEDGLKIMTVLQEHDLLMKISNVADLIVGFQHEYSVCIRQEFQGVKLKDLPFSS